MGEQRSVPPGRPRSLALSAAGGRQVFKEDIPTLLHQPRRVHSKSIFFLSLERMYLLGMPVSFQILFSVYPGRAPKSIRDLLRKSASVKSERKGHLYTQWLPLVLSSPDLNHSLQMVSGFPASGETEQDLEDNLLTLRYYESIN